MKAGIDLNRHVVLTLRRMMRIPAFKGNILIFFVLALSPSPPKQIQTKGVTRSTFSRVLSGEKTDTGERTAVFRCVYCPKNSGNMEFRETFSKVRMEVKRL